MGSLEVHILLKCVQRLRLPELTIPWGLQDGCGGLQEGRVGEFWTSPDYHLGLRRSSQGVVHQVMQELGFYSTGCRFQPTLA